MEIDSDYVGREQALIKHSLLKSYLEVVLSIIGVDGRKTKITYVDCFAGPWGPKGEDLKGTSIAISLEIVSAVREMLNRMPRVPSIEFTAVYVEQNKERFKRLERYLSGNTPNGIRSIPLEGDYFDRQDEILKICGDSFTFFFIDPKGWTDIGIGRLSKLLRRPHSEFLVTFMYDFINRALGMKDLKDEVEKVVGPLSNDDLEHIRGLSSTERGRFVVGKYRRALEHEMGGKLPNHARSYHAEILNPKANRVHYHLVYLTRHPKGLVKFAEASAKASYLQRVVRVQTEFNQTGQSRLFSAEQVADMVRGGETPLSDVKKYWLSMLSDTPLRCDEALLATVLQETGWLVSDIEKAILELLSENRIANLDSKGKRPAHPVHFSKGERLVLGSGN